MVTVRIALLCYAEMEHSWKSPTAISLSNIQTERAVYKHSRLRSITCIVLISKTVHLSTAQISILQWRYQHKYNRFVYIAFS